MKRPKFPQKIPKKALKLSHQVLLVAQWDQEVAQKLLKKVHKLGHQFFWWLNGTMKLPKKTSNKSQKRPKVEPSTLCGGSTLGLFWAIFLQNFYLGLLIFQIA
jgi:hypothetical protein